MKILFSFVILFFTGIAQAQLLNVAAGTNVTIQSGAVFHVDGLSFTPTADFTISNNTLNKSTTVIHTTTNPYITRVYQFANNSGPYSGSVQINYNDGTELNGIPENQLTLNVHNGTLWNYYPATLRDGTNNFILTSGLSSLTLNELTLANLSAPLPIVWLLFTATKQDKTALLQWATAQEQNSRNFIVQHSIDGVSWTNITTLPAAGNSSTTSNYSYVHTNPASGINYYRILQTDLDNRSSLSIIQSLKFATTDNSFTILGNPVTNNKLVIQVNVATGLALFTADGKLLWQQQVSAQLKTIDVSRYAKGTYFLRSNSTTEKIVIQ